MVHTIYNYVFYFIIIHHLISNINCSTLSVSDAASAAAAASSSTSSSTNAAAAANYLSAASAGVGGTADYTKGLSANPVGVQGTTGQILDLTRPIRSVWILVVNSGTKLLRGKMSCGVGYES